MVRRLVATALLALSVCANAQNPSLNGQPAAQVPKRERAPTSYCMYDDKKYSEGAVKSVDGQVLICMARDGIAVSFEGGNEPRELVWELGSSFRGKSRLKASADVTK